MLIVLNGKAVDHGCLLFVGWYVSISPTHQRRAAIS